MTKELGKLCPTSPSYKIRDISNVSFEDKPWGGKCSQKGNIHKDFFETVEVKHFLGIQDW